MDVVEEDAESLLELKEGEEEDDAVVKSITKADVEELLGGSLEEDESVVSVEVPAVPAVPPSASTTSEEKSPECNSSHSPHSSASESTLESDSKQLTSNPPDPRRLPSLLPSPSPVMRGGGGNSGRNRFPPPHRPLMRFFPPHHRLPPPFHPFRGGPPPHPHFMRPPMRRPPPHPLLRHEARFMPPHRPPPYNSVSKALSIARIVVQKKLKAEAEEEAKAKASEPPTTPLSKPAIQPLMSIKTSIPTKLHRPLLPPPRPCKRPLQEPPPKISNNNATPPSGPLLRGGPGQVHSNLRRIQTVDEPPPPKRYSVSDQLKAVSIAHKPSPTLTRINIDPGPPPSSENMPSKRGTRIKISNLPASATFEKMCSMTTACGSVKTINILAEDNSAVIEFMDAQGAETFYRLNNRKMMDLSILNISMI